FYLQQGYSMNELLQLMSREDLEGIHATIAQKAIAYFDIKKQISKEVITVGAKRGQAKSITENQYVELKNENVSDREIAKRFGMSPTSLRKKRSDWEANSSELVITKQQTKEDTAPHVSQQEFGSLKVAYQNLKVEYELLWKYHKHCLVRMESPFVGI